MGKEAGKEEGGMGEGNGEVGREGDTDDAILEGEEEASEGGQADLHPAGGGGEEGGGRREGGRGGGVLGGSGLGGVGEGAGGFFGGGGG